MLERFLNNFLPTDLSKDKYLWILGVAYLLNFSVGQLESFANLTLWGILPAALVFILSIYFRSVFKLPAEVWLYLLFFLWLLITGISVSVNIEIFVVYLRRIIICFLLIMAVCVGLRYSSNIGIIMLCFFLSAYFICGYSLVMGDTLEIIGQEGDEVAYEYEGELYVTGERLHGLVGNANGMGAYSILGFIALSFIYFNAKNLVTRLFYISGGALFAITIIAAGTRGGLGMTAFYLSTWILYILRYKVRQTGAVFVTAGLAVLLGMFINDTLIQTSTVGFRLKAESNVREDKRTKILEDAIEVFAKHPITGVGLAQYQFHSFDAAIAHNEYLEVLTSGGIVGGILYFAMYIIVLRRMLKIRSVYRYHEVRYRIDFFLNILLLFFIYGFIKQHLWDFGYLLLLGVMIGYSYYLPHYLKQESAPLPNDEPARLSA